jgi:hypothetical protein
MADDGIEPTAALIRIPAMKLGSLSVRQVGGLAIAPDDHGPDFILFPREKRRPSGRRGIATHAISRASYDAPFSMFAKVLWARILVFCMDVQLSM